jgi:hypothetical protein
MGQGAAAAFYIYKKFKSGGILHHNNQEGHL